VIFLKNIIKNLGILFLGGIFYAFMEILWRGWTKPVMILIGGIAFWVLYHINTSLNIKNRYLRALFGAVCITLIELCGGIIVNLWLQMSVWDYSERFLNFWGQICPLYFCIWFVLSLFAEKICLQIKRILG
jgi:uncharacterized membrane protein